MQELIVGLIVLGAVAYLVNSMRRSAKGGCGCSDKSCKKNATPKTETLIQISLDKRP